MINVLALIYIYLQKEIVCYLCGEEGHHGKACTKPVCFNCNTPGHMFASCKEPKRSKHMDCYRCEMYGHASYVSIHLV